MSNILAYITNLLWSGWISLLDYLAAHVLLCLVPAFIIAGYLSSMVPKEVVTRYLGPKTRPWISYPAAAVGGFILAVCSCTILPLFAGIWKRGAGLGAAITFLFVGPAVNILAIAYTGAAIGLDIALARILLSILFGIGIGLIMARLFRAEEDRRAHNLESVGLFEQQMTVNPGIWILFLLLLAVLIVGTLQLGWLTRIWSSVNLPVVFPSQTMEFLNKWSLTPQGAALIILLIIIMPTAYLGLENVLEKFNNWTYATLALVGLTLLLAAPVFTSGSLVLGITGRLIAEAILMFTIGLVAIKYFQRQELAGWFWETWKFVKQIFPLLIVGVFLAGVIKVIIPAEWIQSLAGHNTLWANLLGVLFGVFMYFPTLVEVPIARMFLDLGMHRGPLLAYLLADPELSVQSILVTGSILGRKKTAVYVTLVAVFSTLAGYIFGLVLAMV
ncbi:MAG: permease [Anaerolineales bacterium]|nr:MAG: permease [Anaerolineales bacterium]